MKTLISIGLVLLAISAQGAFQAGQARADEGNAERTRTAYFNITGMVTDNCPVLVKEAVRRIEGVKNVRASLEAKTVEVDYVEGQTTPQAIRDVIEDQTGFDAEIERVE